MEYMKEKKPCIDGIPLQYVCHLQDMKGTGMVYPAHYHEYIEILFGREETFEIYLGNSYHRFGPGDMVLIPANAVHLINSLSENGGTYYVIRFLPQLVYNGLSQNGSEILYLLPFLTDSQIQEKVIPHNVLAQTEIPELIDALFQEDAQKPYGYPLAIRNHISSIFLWVLRVWHQKGTAQPVEAPFQAELAAQLTPALSYVQEHCDMPLKASEAARLCGMSSSYFSRCFNHLLHMSFSDYVTRIRLTEAEKLLVSSTLPVTEIAASYGFGSTSYFIRLFRQHKKRSPLQFRKEFMKKETASG